MKNLLFLNLFLLILTSCAKDDAQSKINKKISDSTETRAFCSCDDIDIIRTSAVSDAENGCCTHTIKITNNSTGCTRNLYNAAGQVLMSIGPLQSNVYTFESCLGMPTSYFSVGSSLTSICKRFEVRSTCNDCNSESSCSPSNAIYGQSKPYCHKKTVFGCCELVLNMVHFDKSPCNLYLVDNNGNNYGLFSSGQYFSTPVKICGNTKFAWVDCNGNPVPQWVTWPSGNLNGFWENISCGQFACN